MILLYITFALNATSFRNNTGLYKPVFYWYISKILTCKKCDLRIR